MPDRRTLIVLGLLVGSMTVASGALMMLDPGQASGPRLPHFSEMSLAAFDQPRDPAEALFAVNPTPSGQRWNTIVIRYSGAEQGSAGALGDLHRSAGLDDLAYHFVVGNGQGAGDGLVEIGPRWVQQRPGYTAIALQGRQGSPQVIDICLIGDLDRKRPTDRQCEDLVWLVQQLQKRLNIPSDRVLLGDGQTSRPGKFFPQDWFRQQLSTSAGI